MLTLHKTDDAVPLVGMYQTVYTSGKLGAKSTQRPKKKVDTVYFTHDLTDDNTNSASARGVLLLHKDELKKEMHIANHEFDELCDMIDDDREPEHDHTLRHHYWEIRKHYDDYLKREMYLGDTDDVMFELNLPEKRSDWPGTHTMIGNSGAGKTRYLTDMLLRYLKRTPLHSTRPIFWLSPEVKIDKTLEDIRVPKYNMFFRPIDISEQGLKDSGLDAGSYYKKTIEDPIVDGGHDALICLDDFPDGAKALYPYLRDFFNTSLRTARHRNSGIFSLQHTYAGNKNTTQALQSNKYITFFPRSQQQRCIQFMRDHLLLKTSKAKAITSRFAKLGRAMTIQMHSPVCIFNSKYLVLL